MKVGHKTRRNRRANPEPHKGHRPTRNNRWDRRLLLARKRRSDARAERGAW